MKSAKFSYPGQGSLNWFFRDLLAELGIPEADVPEAPKDVGMSAGTAPKLFEAWRVFDVLAGYAAAINIARKRHGKPPFDFRGIDLTAGPGAYWWKPKNRDPQLLVGTSLLLPHALQKHGLDYRIGLCEREPELAEQLRARLATMVRMGTVDGQRIDVLCGDFADVARPWVRRHVRQYRSQGLMVIDANGATHYEAVGQLLAMPSLRMVDVVLNYQGVQGKWPKTRIPPPTVDEVLALCGKNRKQLGEHRTNFQWTIFYATNNPEMRLLKELGYVWSESVAGEQRLDELRTTRRERRRRVEPRLPGFEEMA
jgi:hypothetical protein